jgi:hypothetical protein
MSYLSNDSSFHPSIHSVKELIGDDGATSILYSLIVNKLLMSFCPCSGKYMPQHTVYVIAWWELDLPVEKNVGGHEYTCDCGEICVSKSVCMYTKYL